MSDQELRPLLPFQIRRLGHVVLNCKDLAASERFYTEVLGFQVSDRYPETLVPGGMVFLRCATDHHTVALVGAGHPERASSLNHFAFEGRRRAGCQIAVEFLDPDGNNLEIYWNLDQVGTDGHVRPSSEWRQAFTLEEAVANPVRGQRLPP